MDYNKSTTENFTYSIDVSTSYLPYWSLVLYYVLYCLIDIIGIIGNCMIIIAVAFSQKLHTSTNVFVTSLAVTDLLTCLAQAVGLIALASLSPSFTLNRFCQFVGFVTVSSVGTSMYTLGAIGIHRLLLITKPILCRRIFASWKLGILVTILCVLPIGSLLIALISGIGSVGFDPVYKECAIVRTHKRAADLDLIIFAVNWPIPFAAVIVSYLWIYVHIKRHFKTQKRHLINLRATSPIGSGCSSSLPRPNQSVVSDREITVTSPQTKKISRQQIHITKNLFVVVCVFFICFVPLAFIVLVGKPSPTISDISWFLQLLGFANSAINFFIYASKHPDFKIVLGHMMRCSYSKIPQPTRLLNFLLSKSN